MRDQSFCGRVEYALQFQPHTIADARVREAADEFKTTLLRIKGTSKRRKGDGLQAGK